MAQQECADSPLSSAAIGRFLEKTVSQAAFPDFVSALEQAGGYIVVHGDSFHSGGSRQWWGIFSPESLETDEQGNRRSSQVFGITNFFGNLDFGLFIPTGTGQLVRSIVDRRFSGDLTGQSVWFCQHWLRAAERAQRDQRALTAMVRAAEQQGPFGEYRDWTWYMPSDKSVVVGRSGTLRIQIRNLPVVSQGEVVFPVVGEGSMRTDGLFYYHMGLNGYTIIR